MDASDIFVTIIGIILLLALLAVFGAMFYYSVRKIMRRRKGIEDDSDSGVSMPMYGAWQGHMMGTTNYEPGELTKIERELGTQPKENED